MSTHGCTSHSTPDLPLVANSVTDLIGGSPLVRVNRLVVDGGAPVLVKAEFLSPGGSIKDRIALRMIEAAEATGELRPGATIIDSTSGNTGIGLALVAATRGYRSIFVCSEKVSVDKVAVLRAYGAEVVRTPGNVTPDDPRSAHSVADRLAESIPGAWSSRQYDNPENPAAHYATTGPEVWAQTAGRVTHFVANLGTGGTICGTGRYLHEVSQGRVRVVGADPVGSAYSGPVAPYLVEGAGRTYDNEELWPATYDRAVVDEIVRVADADSFATARAAARVEGLLVGPSAGTALHAALELAAGLDPARHLVVALLADTGRGYLSKLFDDEWLRANGLPSAAGEREGLVDRSLDAGVDSRVRSC